MNLKQLRPSSRAPVAGDVFVFQLAQVPGQYWFGRVVRTDTSVGVFKGNILIYLYGQHSESKEAIPDLDVNCLLAPPLHTNRLPWSKGYFETVTNRPLGVEDLLPRHVFADIRGRHFDADSQPVDGPVPESVGQFGVHSFRTIDDLVSRALGIPLSGD